MSDERTALQKLLDEPKGKVAFSKGEAFLLHVFWEAPNQEKANQLLEALEQCAKATHRDTPCVPTYFFRMSNNDKDLYGNAPKLVSEHKTLAAAIKKVQVGVSRAAVNAEVLKNGLDPAFLDLSLTEELPPSLRNQKPVALEFTEVYLDERAFMEHAGSMDYLKGYGTVMSPGMTNSPPITIRLGTPKESLVEKILEPMLKERVFDLRDGFHVWKQPVASETGIFFSIDLKPSERVSKDLLEQCVWCVSFPHQLREETTRCMGVIPGNLYSYLVTGLTTLKPIRGEIHTSIPDVNSLRKALDEHGLELITINATTSSGYTLHEKTAILKSE
jgi:hypothetical protein